MAEEINYADIIQQYHGNIVLYKGSVVYVSSVSEEKPHKAIVYRLIDGKRLTAQFNTDDFTPPNLRIGNVNAAGGVVYVSRKPVRRMNVGLNKNNIQISQLPIYYPEGWRAASDAIHSMKSADLARTMLGQYPGFDECLDYVKSFKGAMAFDRQFCIDNLRQIYYKDKYVGDLPKNCTKLERIVFHKAHEGLELLIGDNCAKTLQAVGS